MTQMFACMYSSGEGTARLLADRAFERGDVKWILRQTQFPRHESEQSHEVVRKSRFDCFFLPCFCFCCKCVGVVAHLNCEVFLKWGWAGKPALEPGSRRIYGQHFSR